MCSLQKPIYTNFFRNRTISKFRLIRSHLLHYHGNQYIRNTFRSIRGTRIPLYTNFQQLSKFQPIRSHGSHLGTLFGWLNNNKKRTKYNMSPPPPLCLGDITKYIWRQIQNYFIFAMAKNAYSIYYVAYYDSAMRDYDTAKSRLRYREARLRYREPIPWCSKAIRSGHCIVV